MEINAEPVYRSCERDCLDAAVRGPSPTLALPRILSHQVESQDTPQRRLEASSDDLPRGNISPAESWPCEQWKSDRSVDNRSNHQNLARPAHMSNLQPNEKEVPLLQSETEAKEGKNVFVRTATFRVEGTSPFSVESERMQSVTVEMLAEKKLDLPECAISAG